MNDGISYLNVAQDTVGQLGGITDRLRELASQAANGTYSTTQRSALGSEATRLVAEYNRLIASTSFNGTSIFGNGRMNINWQGGTGTNGVITTQIGTGLSTSTTTTTDAIGSFNFTGFTDGYTGSAALGDITGDGKIDMVQADASGNLHIFQGNGSTGMSEIGSISSAGVTGTVKIGDYDNDGNLDLFAITNTKVSIYKGYGDGTFAFTDQFTPVATNIADLDVGDFDHDGQTDFVVSGKNNSQIEGWRSKGDGSFEDVGGLTGPGGDFNKIKLIDIDQDGYLDVISSAASAGKIQISLGDGVTFTSYTSYTSTSGSISAIAVGDIDGNGRLDIISGTSTGKIDVLSQDSGLSFTNHNIYNSSTNFTTLAVADYDHDGDQDIVGGSAGSTDVLKNNGSLAFTLTINVKTTGSSGALVSDLNADGVDDIVAYGASGYVGLGSVTGGSTTTTSTNQISQISLTSAANARAALDTLDLLAQKISAELSTLGASQSRLATSLRTLGVAQTETQAARNRIVDADVAQESSSMIRGQILKQIGAAVLAQANQQPALALQLLKI